MRLRSLWPETSQTVKSYFKDENRGKADMKQNNFIKVIIEDLTPESFAPFGQAITIPKSKPTKSGDGWDCWSPVALIENTTPMGIGILATSPLPLMVTEMERHVSREEMLWPTDLEIIQPMAPPGKLDAGDAQPDPRTVRAFRIKPGQAIIMAKGAWHSPAFTERGRAVYFFAIEKKADKNGSELNPWVSFMENRSIQVVRA